MNFPTSRTLKSTAVLATATGLMALGAGAASAHVSVDPASTSAGGFSQLTFKVPNESGTAKTTKLTVTLPAGTPFTSVSVKPMDGWKAQVITASLPKPVQVDGATITKAPSSVVWTADTAHQIGQNEFQTFTLSVGRLPGAGTTVTLPAVQGYTDGTTVNWSDKAEAAHDHTATASSTPATEEQESHPAPSFVTTAGETAETAHSATEASSTTPAAATSSNGGDVAGWVGLAAGLIGLAAGGTALARTRTARTS